MSARLPNSSSQHALDLTWRLHHPRSSHAAITCRLPHGTRHSSLPSLLPSLGADPGDHRGRSNWLTRATFRNSFRTPHDDSAHCANSSQRATEVNFRGHDRQGSITGMFPVPNAFEVPEKLSDVLSVICSAASPRQLGSFRQQVDTQDGLWMI
jgi:hypothetical protein